MQGYDRQAAKIREAEIDKARKEAQRKTDLYAAALTLPALGLLVLYHLGVEWLILKYEDYKITGAPIWPVISGFIASLAGTLWVLFRIGLKLFAVIHVMKVTWRQINNATKDFDEERAKSDP